MEEITLKELRTNFDTTSKDFGVDKVTTVCVNFQTELSKVV